jgi:hypothetical protein
MRSEKTIKSSERTATDRETQFLDDLEALCDEYGVTMCVDYEQDTYNSLILRVEVDQNYPYDGEDPIHLLLDRNFRLSHTRIRS